MSKLEQQFKATLDYINNSDDDFTLSNELKLEMYALYKQATEGDVHGKKPSLMDLVGKAKYKAWADLKGTNSEQAMQQYIDRVEELKSSNG